MSWKDQVISYVLENLPEILGAALLAAVVGLAAWLWPKLAKRMGGLAVEQPPELPAPRQWTPSDYFVDLIRRSSTLSFGDPASWSAVGSGEKHGLVTLDEIWTPLRVADSQSRVGKVGTHENMAEEAKGVGLRELFASTHQALLILGDPGSGKSTSLASFALDSATKWKPNTNDVVPIWVNLGSSGVGARGDAESILLAGVPELEVAASRGGGEAFESLNGFLRDAIRDGRALLLLDGLDEVKEHVLDEVRRAIAQVLKLRNNTRLLVTCRTFDYRLSTPNRKIPIERELELLPYNAAERKLYVERWYAAAIRVGRFTPAQATELSAALVVELKGDTLAELAESPLLLALLTLIHSEEAKLPDTRAVVCDRAITYMLADSAKWRVREAGSSTLASPPVLSLATELAYESHIAEETRQTPYTGVTKETIDAIAVKICRLMAEADTAREAPSAQDLAQRLLKSHGLLLESGGGRFKFAHRSFQEFLAGQYYAAGAPHDEALARAPLAHWREPFRLMASLAGHEGNNLYYILTLVDALLRDSNSVSSIQIGAEMLTEIGRRRLALRKFGNVLEEERAPSGLIGMWARARRLSAEHVENDRLSLSDRERSATCLGLLGDPRLSEGDQRGGPWRHLVSLPAASATIGTDRLKAEVLSTSGGFIDAARTIACPALKVGRYLVTNADFRGFVEGDGYTNARYWPGDYGRGWMSGRADVLRAIREHWLSTVHEHHAKEIRDGEIDTKVLEEEATSRTAPRQAPYYWFDRRFSQPNQPVVGVNWWEAMAFCEWATERAHVLGTLQPDWSFVLPTEFEWERISRPSTDDRIYPWGDQWSDERAHVSTNTLNMRQPAPVGIYLESWPGGPCDIAGNVWEWTASLFLPYASEHDSRRLLVDSLDERVVRGSSWYNSSIVAACSARAVDRSYNLFYDVGFRMIALQRESSRI
jgi:formylglycine-generating enzyme required for sulfatase activity